MTKVMAVNAGSSTLKWQLFQMPEEQKIAGGMIDRLGKENAHFIVEYGDGQKIDQEEPITTHELAAAKILTRLKELGIVEHLEEITGVGHRVVAGGELFKSSTRITQQVLDQIKELKEYAPLHNAIEAYYIGVFQELLPHATQVAVFDTSFYSTLEPEDYLYSIDLDYYKRFRARKYGAHGTSHRYVSSRAAELMGKPAEDLKLITLHLGSGASISAIDGGKAVDTSMGFTPLAGITMGTRCGDIDPSLIPYLMQQLGITDINEFIDILNKKSGLLGLSGLSADMRDLEDTETTNERSALALSVFVNRVVKYVGAYVARLGGVDGIVFTAGSGENGIDLRQRIGDRLSAFGVKIDPERNHVRGKERLISTDDSKVTAFIIPTNEELMIARDTYALHVKDHKLN
ncbi:acetate/propionate family kinase [Agrilactobacillus yilanensis]|uniref:Acetate kinase n=1 Tax=Agrilactobacillus yilanensis TaxID=2485997 RepID=A0ABW4J8U0_9LACO|nr:acetate kinase [Agrilactobacillus yilanensis]